MAAQTVATGVRTRQVGSGVATGQFSNPQDFEFCRSNFTVYVDYTGTITTASIQLQASPDGGTTWFNIGTASTVATDHAFSVTGVAASMVRVAVTITGGGTAKLFMGAA